MSSVVDYASRNAWSTSSRTSRRAWRSSATITSAPSSTPSSGKTRCTVCRTTERRPDSSTARTSSRRGIAEPPKTWEELEAAAQALTTEGQYGYIMFAPEAAYYWYPYLWQNGGELLSEDGTTIPLQ